LIVITDKILKRIFIFSSYEYHANKFVETLIFGQISDHAHEDSVHQIFDRGGSKERKKREEKKIRKK